MVTTTRGHEIKREQPLGLRWLPFVNRAVFLRSAIVAVVSTCLKICKYGPK